MKRTYKYLIMCIILIVCTSFTYVDSYGDKVIYNTRNGGIVPVNKVWKIKFSKEVKKESLYSKIKVVDEHNKKAYIKIEVDTVDKKIVYVKPGKNYVPGKKYKLIISPDIKGKGDLKLEKGFIVNFSTKNLYSGLPYEDGLLIIGNLAYSIDYLAKNSQIKNDILKGDHSVFYIYEEATDKVKDILGDKFIDGNTKPPEYDVKKPIEYIDAQGNKTIYAWNKDKETFEVTNPSVDIKISVNVNSNGNKVLMINVEKANWIDGAFYYKLDNSGTCYKIGEPVIFSSTDTREYITIFSGSMTKLGEGTIHSYLEGKYNIDIKLFPKKGEGNSAGNIVNNGYVAADENGYIFYNNTGDKNKLYKYDTNGIFHGVISDDFAQYINVDGEWIYYSNYLDKAKLYRIKVDGSSKQKLNDEYSAFITVVGDFIYYSNHTDNGRIMRIRKDGSDATVDDKGEKHGISISSEVRDEAMFLNYVGDWIYYSNINDHYKVYAVNTNGTYRKQLSDEGASSIQVVDDWIYYTNNKGELRKVKTDGSKETEDLNSVVSKFDRGYFFNVVDEWIYYSNDKDSKRLYKIKTDGTENTRLTIEPVTYINIAYNTIYFVSKGNMFTVPIDTNGRIRPVAVKRITSDKKIVQVDDVNVIVPYDEVNDTIEDLEERYFPNKVPGIMSDNRMQQFVVQWDKKNVTIRNGVRTYTGKLIGFNQYIKLAMRIPSEMLNETTTIKIFNNAGKRNGYIEVYSDPVMNDEVNIPPKLREGDELKLYEDKDLTKLLRTTTVSRQGIHNKGIFQSIDLDRYGTNEYYITIKRLGKAESKGTAFTVGEAPVITNSKYWPVIDEDVKGLGIDGRDFTIKQMRTTKNKDVDESYIYLTVRGRQLRLQTGEARPFDENKVSETDTDWKGRRYQKTDLEDNENYPREKGMNVDSFGNALTGTSYDLFLVSKYPDTASPDNRGACPTIEGWAVSEPASITVKSEGLPYDPGLKSETKKFGDTISLQVTPKPGETAYLIPVWDRMFEKENYNKYLEAEKVEEGKEKRWERSWFRDIKIEYGSEEIVTTLLDEARVWLSQNGEFPYGNYNENNKRFKDEESHKIAVEQFEEAVFRHHITKLEGDGRSRIIEVPTGIQYQREKDDDDDVLKEMKNSIYYAPNVKYKLVIVNEIGVSSVSNGTLTVDNQPPVVTKDVIEGDNIIKDGVMYVLCGDTIEFQSRYEKSDIYIYNKSSHNLDDVQILEDAVDIGEALKFSVRTGVSTELDTKELKPFYGESSEDKDNARMIWVADEVGNIKSIQPVMVYVDIAKLEQAKVDAILGINQKWVLYDDIEEVEKKIQDMESTIKTIKEDHSKEIITQSKINVLVEESIALMIEKGIPHYNEDLPSYEKKEMLKKFLTELRLFNPNKRSSAANLKQLTEDVWLPSKFAYLGIPGTEEDVYYEIEWTKEYIGSGTGNLIDIKDGELGEVNRAYEDESIKLIATCTGQGETFVLPPYFITVKAKTFFIMLPAKATDKATIVLDGLQVDRAGEIIIPLIPWDGVNYSFKREKNGDDWNITVVPDDTNNKNSEDEKEIPISITIDTITINDQVKLQISKDGTARIIRNND